MSTSLVHANAIIPSWGVAWIIFSNAAVVPDFLFVLFQPHSLPDGKYGNMFPFNIWQIYASWDKRYSNPEDIFNQVQSILNIVELAVGVGTIMTLGPRSELGAKIIAVISVMTFYKTCIYFLMEIVCGFENIAHNSVPLNLFVTLLSLPWIIVPALLSKTILRQLHAKGKTN